MESRSQSDVEEPARPPVDHLTFSGSVSEGGSSLDSSEEKTFQTKGSLVHVFSEAEPEVLEPPHQTRKDLVEQQLRMLAQSSPKVYESIMKNQQMVLDSKLSEILHQHTRSGSDNLDAAPASRDQEDERAEADTGGNRVAPMLSAKSSGGGGVYEAFSDLIKNSKKAVEPVTVVDYPSTGDVEVFSKFEKPPCAPRRSARPSNEQAPVIKRDFSGVKESPSAGAQSVKSTQSNASRSSKKSQKLKSKGSIKSTASAKSAKSSKSAVSRASSKKSQPVVKTSSSMKSAASAKSSASTKESEKISEKSAELKTSSSMKSTASSKPAASSKKGIRLEVVTAVGSIKSAIAKSNTEDSEVRKVVSADNVSVLSDANTVESQREPSVIGPPVMWRLKNAGEKPIADVPVLKPPPKNTPNTGLMSDAATFFADDADKPPSTDPNTASLIPTSADKVNAILHALATPKSTKADTPNDELAVQKSTSNTFVSAESAILVETSPAEADGDAEEAPIAVVGLADELGRDVSSFTDGYYKDAVDEDAEPPAEPVSEEPVEEKDESSDSPVEKPMEVAQPTSHRSSGWGRKLKKSFFHRSKPNKSAADSSKVPSSHKESAVSEIPDVQGTGTDGSEDIALLDGSATDSTFNGKEKLAATGDQIGPTDETPTAGHCRAASPDRSEYSGVLKAIEKQKDHYFVNDNADGGDEPIEKLSQSLHDTDEGLEVPKTKLFGNLSPRSNKGSDSSSIIKVDYRNTKEIEIVGHAAARPENVSPPDSPKKSVKSGNKLSRMMGKLVRYRRTGKKKTGTHSMLESVIKEEEREEEEEMPSPETPKEEEEPEQEHESPTDEEETAVDGDDEIVESPGPEDAEPQAAMTTDSNKSWLTNFGEMVSTKGCAADMLCGEDNEHASEAASKTTKDAEVRTNEFMYAIFDVSHQQ